MNKLKLNGTSDIDLLLALLCGLVLGVMLGMFI